MSRCRRRWVDAVAELGAPYDDLLIDEAQDLHVNWFEALMLTLRDEEKGSVWLFLDDNQRIYDSDLEIPEGFVQFDLNVNCRNTQAIHRQVAQLYRGEVVPEVKGPEGRDIEMLHTADQPAAVAALLKRFVEDEELRAKRDIVVLSGHGREKSAVYNGMPGPIRLSDERGKRGVFFSSIRGFKGLGSPLVILCELENLDDVSRDNQLYVGMSRARNQLCARGAAQRAVSDFAQPPSAASRSSASVSSSWSTSAARS